MSRMARSAIMYDGCYAHVISRSIRKQKIFNDEEDFRVFIDLLGQSKKQASYRIFHYCLMHTHFHLAVQIPHLPDFSKAFQRLKSYYTYKYHTKYRLSGPIWRERFRGLLIENESYMYACGRYIERNPVEAGLVKRALEWPFSSCQYYETGKADGIVDGYPSDTLPAMPKHMDLEDRSLFECGAGIGSNFFKLQLMEAVKESAGEI